MKKAIWNSLPAKKEDIDRISLLLTKEPRTRNDLIAKSLLSKTRCLSALDELIFKKLVTTNEEKKFYFCTPSIQSKE